MVEWCYICHILIWIFIQPHTFDRHCWTHLNALKCITTFPMNACNFNCQMKNELQHCSTRWQNALQRFPWMYATLIAKRWRMNYSIVQRIGNVSLLFCVTIELVAKGQCGTHSHSNMSFSQYAAHLPMLRGKECCVTTLRDYKGSAYWLQCQLASSIKRAPSWDGPKLKV